MTCASIDFGASTGSAAMAILRGFMASGNVAQKIDVQQAVLQRSRLDLDMIGKLEAALEGALGDAAIEDIR